MTPLRIKLKRLTARLPSQDKQRAKPWLGAGAHNQNPQHPNKIGYGLAPGGRGQPKATSPDD